MQISRRSYRADPKLAGSRGGVSHYTLVQTRLDRGLLCSTKYVQVRLTRDPIVLVRGSFARQHHWIAVSGKVDAV
jgi:hypothetical protein